MRKNILKELWAHRGKYISGETLAKKTGISRVAVWKHIQALKENGYKINSNRGKGYSMEEDGNIIMPTEIARHIRGQSLGNPILYYPVLDSTNDTIKDLLSTQALTAGTVVIAGKQMRGKGRLGRTWESPRGTVCFSVLLKPNLPVAGAALLSLVFAVAICKALNESYSMKSNVKWPNDILLEGKKAGGILLELSGEIDSTDNIIAGIGLNVNVDGSFPEFIHETATSLYQQSGRILNINEVLATVLRYMDTYYHRYLQEGFTGIRNEFISYCPHIGQEIQVLQGQKPIKGLNIGIDDSGHLLLREESGKIIKVSTGDVMVLK